MEELLLVVGRRVGRGKEKERRKGGKEERGKGKGEKRNFPIRTIIKRTLGRTKSITTIAALILNLIDRRRQVENSLHKG